MPLNREERKAMSMGRPMDTARIRSEAIWEMRAMVSNGREITTRAQLSNLCDRLEFGMQILDKLNRPRRVKDVDMKLVLQFLEGPENLN